jgi:hypothetical protein
MPNESKCILKKDNRVLHIHLISIKNQTVPFVPNSPAASHKNFQETRYVVSYFAIKNHIKHGELSIPFQIQIPPEPLAKVTGKE